MRSAQFLLAALCLGALKPAAAQRQHRFSVDLMAGMAEVSSEAPYVDETPVVLDALAAIRWKNGPGHSLVAGANGTGFRMTGHDAVCSRLPIGEGCLPAVPTLYSRALLLGWEALHSSGASLRFLVGPSWFRSSQNDPQTMGHAARIDLATPHLGWLAFAMSFRWSHVSSFRNGEIDYRSVGLGVRLR